MSVFFTLFLFVEACAKKNTDKTIGCNFGTYFALGLSESNFNRWRKENEKNCLFVCLFVCLWAGAANATVIDLDPGTGIISESGPFGYGGRGVVVRAESDFTMSNLAMEGTWSGLLDLAVEVYDLNSGSRGSLLSQTTYNNQAAQLGAFFDFDHTYSFSAGNIYEIMMKFSDPGVRFTHYNFDNSGLNITNGVLVDSSILLLDGSDFDHGHAGNFWTPHFKLTTGASTPPPSVPEPASLALMGLGLAGMGFLRRKKEA